MGDPPLQENGLPNHFTLGASSDLSKTYKRGEVEKNEGERKESSLAVMALNDNSRQNSARSSLMDDLEGIAAERMSGKRENGMKGSYGIRKKVGNGGSELPSADRMHVTLFFRSL